jgi:hypothetical protein
MRQGSSLCEGQAPDGGFRGERIAVLSWLLVELEPSR